MLTAAHLERTEHIMRDVCADFDCELAEFNGEANHMHQLVNFPPGVAISRLASSLKGRVVPQAAAGIPRLSPRLPAGGTPVV